MLQTFLLSDERSNVLQALQTDLTGALTMQ
jgi:hypothetical protein